MKKRIRWSSFFAFIFVPVIAGTAAAQDQKAPAKNGPQLCISCHEASDSNHRRSYDTWQASAHSKTLGLIIKNSAAGPDCYTCHSDEGLSAKMQGRKVDLAEKETFNPVTCTTCHNPHESKNPHQLKMDPETLCSSCHSQRAILKGEGAKGVDEARSFHSGVECISCHMTEGNHLMKLIRPDDPNVPEKRVDTCTGCHKDNNRQTRAGQIRDWQDTFKKEMDALQEDVKLITAALKSNPNLLDAATKAKWSDVTFNLALLTKDGSRGAHNFDLSLAILDSAAKDLRTIKALVQTR